MIVNPLLRRTPLYNTLQRLPKIELHRHLEGALRLATLVDIARQYALDVPHTAEELRPLVQIVAGEPTTSAHFLSKFEVLRRFYRSPEVIQRLAREVVEDAIHDHVHYMELRFTPKALAKLNGYSFDEVIGWVCQAVNEAQRDQPIQVRLIVSVNRHEAPEEAHTILKAALAHQHQGIVGFDLAGQEFSTTAFNSIFAQARQAGLHITAHAGEWSGPATIRNAIEELGATRIGHGVRILEDPEVTALALERGITFEVCPTSNVQSGVIRYLAEHPAHAMLQAGLRVSLNTDDPSISAINLSDELYEAITALNFSTTDIKAVLLHAAHSAFLPAEERATLVQEFSQLTL